MRIAAPGWDVRFPVDSDEAHVVPVNDRVQHDAVDCICGPTCTPHERADGSIGFLLAHHSLDGREAME